MFKVKKLSWVIGCALALNGCAMPFQSRTSSLNDINVKPVEKIQHAGSKPMIMYLLGRYYQGKVQYEKAVDAYHKALVVKPNFVEVHNGLGIIYAVEGKLDLALQHFSTAIELAPKKSYLHNNLGYAYLIHGLEYEAAESFKVALQIDSRNEQARKNLITAFERLGFYEDILALEHIETEAGKIEAVNGDYEKLEKISKPETELVQVSPNIYEYHPIKREYASPKTAMSTKNEFSKPANIAKSNNLMPKELSNMRIEVSNGNGVTGMANQVSQYLEKFGAAGVRLTNHQTFQQLDTEIHYRSGSLPHANQLKQMLPSPAKVVVSEELRSDIQVKILLGKDISREFEFFN